MKGTLTRCPEFVDHYILIRIGETGAIAGGINDFIKCHGVVPYRGV